MAKSRYIRSTDFIVAFCSAHGIPAGNIHTIDIHAEAGGLVEITLKAFTDVKTINLIEREFKEDTTQHGD